MLTLLVTFPTRRSSYLSIASDVKGFVSGYAFRHTESRHHRERAALQRRDNPRPHRNKNEHEASYRYQLPAEVRTKSLISSTPKTKRVPHSSRPLRGVGTTNASIAVFDVDVARDLPYTTLFLSVLCL